MSRDEKYLLCQKLRDFLFMSPIERYMKLNTHLNFSTISNSNGST